MRYNLNDTDELKKQKLKEKLNFFIKKNIPKPLHHRIIKLIFLSFWKVFKCFSFVTGSIFTTMILFTLMVDFPIHRHYQENNIWENQQKTSLQQTMKFNNDLMGKIENSNNPDKLKDNLKNDASVNYKVKTDNLLIFERNTPVESIEYVVSFDKDKKHVEIENTHPDLVNSLKKYQKTDSHVSFNNKFDGKEKYMEIEVKP